MYQNTWECGEFGKLYFPNAPEDKNKQTKQANSFLRLRGSRSYRAPCTVYGTFGDHIIVRHVRKDTAF